MFVGCFDIMGSSRTKVRESIMTTSNNIAQVFYVIPAYGDTKNVPVNLDMYEKEYRLLGKVMQIFEKNRVEALGYMVSPFYWINFLNACKEDFKKSGIPEDLLYKVQLYQGNDGESDNKEPVWSISPNEHLKEISAIVELSQAREIYEKSNKNINNCVIRVRKMENMLISYKSSGESKEVINDLKSMIKNVRTSRDYKEWSVIFGNIEQELYDCYVKYGFQVPDEIAHLAKAN